MDKQLSAVNVGRFFPHHTMVIIPWNEALKSQPSKATMLI